MMTGPRIFDPEKAVEAIAYLTNKAGTGLYETLKLVYLADKQHLERYGRLIFGDWYVAMPLGPVPSQAYDVMKFVRGDRASSLAAHAKDAFTVDPNTHAIALLREPILDELSESDIECLDAAVAEYGHLGFNGLKRLTHDAAYNATQRNQEITLDAIASTLLRAPELIQHLADSHPDRG